ncbi:diiron oxygenase [Actinocorallia longicatena]|uniref:Diiron oxygenase n=1 Tax=Actinocorallia longicatena TaxID=111803 RepID=A0ABP6QB93_9ACTN
MSTAVIHCKDGDHTLDLMDREVVAERLLSTSRKHSFDPDVDVAWDTPVEPDRFFMPPECVSLFETPLWDGLTRAQRIELSRRELASTMSYGIYAELMLMQALVLHAWRREVDSKDVAYALTEIADECRHSMMFARLIRTLGLRATRPPQWMYQAGKVIGGIYQPVQKFSMVLVVEETTDTLQRAIMADSDLQPLVRQVCKIHVIEESRHIKYAREELKRQVANLSPARRRAYALMISPGAYEISRALIHPSCYSGIGLDPKEAARAAAASPHRRETVAWMFRRTMGFFEEVGLLDGPARKVWQHYGILQP